MRKKDFILLRQFSLPLESSRTVNRPHKLLENEKKNVHMQYYQCTASLIAVTGTSIQIGRSVQTSCYGDNYNVVFLFGKVLKCPESFA